LITLEFLYTNYYEDCRIPEKDDDSDTEDESDISHKNADPPHIQAQKKDPIGFLRQENQKGLQLFQKLNNTDRTKQPRPSENFLANKRRSFPSEEVESEHSDTHQQGEGWTMYLNKRKKMKPLADRLSLEE
jgi:hypothetical protein